MLVNSPIFSQMSGKLGGGVASRNKGGQYFKKNAIPTNPNTPAQVEARDALSTLNDRWTNILTQPQRDGWDIYALNVPLINKLGVPKTRSGQNQYVRSNQPRDRNGEVIIDDAPGIFDLGTFTTPSLSISAAAPDQIEVTFDDSDLWANTTGAFLFSRTSRGQNASIKFFKGPFRSGTFISGADAGITSPLFITSDFNYVEGQQVFVEFRAAQLDARLSSEQIVGTIVTA